MDVASSREPLVRAADHFRSAGDLGGEARALMELVQAQLAIAALGEPVDVTRLEQVLEGLAATDDGLYAHGVAQLAEAYWVGGDADRAATTAQRALDLGRRAEHAGACALAQITLSTIAWMQLDLRDALATLEGALEDARAHDDPWYEGVVLPRIALTHLWLGQLDEAAATAQAASDKASWIGDRAEQTFALAAAVGVEAARGNYPAAETAAADAWLALRLSRYAWGASFFLPVLADVRSRLGSTDAAERALDQWTGLESGPATLVEEPAWALRQLVRARAGFAVGAALESDAARLDARWPVTLGTVARFATLAELAERTDAPVDLARIERALERALARGMVLTEGPVFLVARVHALVTWLLGHVEEADARYRTAIETAERLEMSPELARACGEHARVLDSLGQHEAARAAADRAAALEAQIGRSDGAGDTGREGEVVIMFTDVVDSTRLTEALGDAAYRGRADALDLRLRTVVRERGGRPEEGITLGDGIVALFASGRGAIECAVHAHALARENGLELRVGLHAGDVSRSASGIYGGAVNLTARVCDLADARETLASETVRGLARTSADVGFLDRGLHELKGITEPVHLYAVTAH